MTSMDAHAVSPMRGRATPNLTVGVELNCGRVSAITAALGFFDAFGHDGITFLTGRT